MNISLTTLRVSSFAAVFAAPSPLPLDHAATHASTPHSEQAIARSRVQLRGSTPIQQQRRRAQLLDWRRIKRLSTVKMRIKVLMALQSGAPVLNGTGTAEQVHKKLLLFYRLTGVELTYTLALI